MAGSHFSSSSRHTTLPTPPEWLTVGAAMGDLANKWSKRNDIIATVGPEAGSGAPACFKPAIAEMEINTTAAFGDTALPEFVGDFNDRLVQFEYPVAAGAILHEAMHARHSRWSLEEVDKFSRLSKENRVLANLIQWFEESRIEARGVDHYKRNRSFLRACALKIVVGDMKPSEITGGGVIGLSQIMLLTMARVDAGVLEPEDIEEITEKATEFLGKKVVKKLRKIWLRAQAHNRDREWEPLRKCAEDWVKLLEDEGHDASGTSGAEGELAKILGEMMGAMGEMAEETETEARSEGTTAIVAEMAEEEAKERAAAAAEAGEAGEASSRVFDKTTGHSGTTGSRSRMTDEREPTPEERAAAITIARLLEQARYRDRVTITRSNKLPPGRLRGRAAVAAAADRAAGRVPTAEPWRSRRRYHTEDPKLTVGMMTDISGSMGSAMEPMAVTNWVMSEAVRRVQGRIASVYYGNGVFPGLAPGEHLKKVKIMTAPDSTERFDEAFKALNGALDLLNGRGARLLVIVSDFCYTSDQVEALQKWMARCKQSGVAVINLPFGNDSYTRVIADDPTNDVRVLTGITKPAEAALVIGTEAAAALTNQASGGRG